MNLAADSATKYLEKIMDNRYKDDSFFMKEALKEAKKSLKTQDVPVGAILVVDNKIIARAHNTKEKEKSIMGHAEVNVLKKASKKYGVYIFDNATLYVTLEPCLMCAGAIMQSHIKRIVFAAKEPKYGSFGSVIDASSSEYRFTNKIEVTRYLLEEESVTLIRSFFHKIREEKKQEKLSNR